MDNIHHIAIQVNDIQEAVDWYSDRFNVEISYQDQTWAMLKFENLSLAMVLPGQHPPHFAITDDQADRFGELKKHRDGTASVYLTDPFGNSVEILKTDC